MSLNSKTTISDHIIKNDEADSLNLILVSSSLCGKQHIIVYDKITSDVLYLINKKRINRNLTNQKEASENIMSLLKNLKESLEKGDIYFE